MDDSLFIFPPSAEQASALQISRGPNIGAPPVNTPLPESLNGVAAIKVGEKITTDHIMPAGARLKFRSNVPAYSQYVFEPVDPAFPQRAAALRDAGKHNIIVADASYGQGSSREHAALCPMYLGVKAVIARSIERIHMANLFNFGIIPFVFAQSEDYDKIDQDDELIIADLHTALTAAVKEGKPVLMENRTKQLEIPLRADFSERQIELLLAGGLLNYTKNMQKEA